ncbi:phage integrase SAM-like domain-containing protein [Maribacter arcticus]|uniref:phage integrase SAM-like domain-containing protein n=1 Tax=Maribacter arcticus TaxID=561365 RepID=UPI0030030DB2
MATVNFLYRSKKDEAPLNVRLLYRVIENDNYKDYVLGAKTQFTVSKHYWTKEHSLKRVRDIEIANKQTEVNTELNKLENHILNAFSNIQNTTINKTWLQSTIDNYYNPVESKSIPTDLISFIDYYSENRKDEVSIVSIRKFNVIKHKMQRLQEYRGKTILLSEIGEDFKEEFKKYYQSENYAQNTTQRELGIIKTFCKEAHRKGLVINKELDSLKLKPEKTKPLYLNFKELAQIEKTKNLAEHLENARDWLIISCYTGQRISDFLRFNKDMIRVEKGKSLLEFKQQKTQKLMTIPLHEKVLSILDKRSGDFPRAISDQKYNDYIKQVCEKSKLKQVVMGKKQTNIEKDNKKPAKIRNVSGTFEKWELVTSHIGRRSFATNFYGQIPTNYLIYVTGHSSESLFLKYIGKSNKDIAMELTKYF